MKGSWVGFSKNCSLKFPANRSEMFCLFICAWQWMQSFCKHNLRSSRHSFKVVSLPNFPKQLLFFQFAIFFSCVFMLWAFSSCLSYRDVFFQFWGENKGISRKVFPCSAVEILVTALEFIFLMCFTSQRINNFYYLRETFHVVSIALFIWEINAHFPSEAKTFFILSTKTIH